MTTALLILLTAALVLLVSRLDYITVVFKDGDKRGGDRELPKTDDGPRELKGGREERGKLKN